MKSLIVIPTYNEIENISSILTEVLRATPEAHVLVVDDNSPDGTGKKVAELAAQSERLFLLSRAGKEGLALAYLAGFRWGIENGYEALVQMDADFSHYPTDVPRILEGLKTHDLVIASRYTAGGFTSGWGWMRKLISRGGNVYARMILGAEIQDMTGGFNGWRKDALESVNFETVRSKGYAYQVELKHRAVRKGCRILEIPIHFRNRTLGSSKMSGAIVGEAAMRVWQMRTH